MRSFLSPTKPWWRSAVFVIALTSGGVAEAAHSQRSVSIGRSYNLGAINPDFAVGYPGARDQGAIVGMAIAGSTDHTYVWYAEGLVSSGTSQNFQYHTGKRTFSVATDKDPWDIIAIAIAGSNDHVFTWYADGTVSEGTSRNLDAYAAAAPFTLPPGKQISDIVGIAIAGSTDHVYAWYADGTVSSGWSRDLDAYRAPYSFVVPAGKKIGHIIDIGITGSNDRVYAWYHDVELGSGHGGLVNRVDAAAMDVLRRWRLPGLGVSVSKNGRMVLEKGYGFRNFTTGSRMQRNSRCRIGSVSKVITSLSAMHLDQQRADFSVTDRIYTNGGPLSGGYYGVMRNIGVQRHQPIVGKAIASNDRVYTWYHDRTASSGTSANSDLHSGPYNYSLAPNMDPEDVRAIAISPNDRVWVWYDDGTYSSGTSWDLDRYVARDPDAKVSVPGHSMSHIVGIDFSSSGSVYVWYDDGTQSAGTTSNFGANIAPRSYSTAPGQTPYLIRGIGIAKSSNHVYTFYNNRHVTEGHSRNLDAYGGPWFSSVPAYAYDASKDWSDWYADIRVDHLMSHSSGFSRSGDGPAAATMFSTVEDALGYEQVHQYVLGTRKLLFAPGTSESYSNHGAGTVAHIVSVVSGMPFHNYARANIIDPLGLNIRSHSDGQNGFDTYRHRYTNELPEAYIDDSTNDLGLGAGGWKSSAGDLVRLMLGTDKNNSHPDVLLPATIDAMETRPCPGFTSFAHGWDKDSNGKLAHNGRLGGGTTYATKYPSDYFGGSSAPMTVAVCTPISISDNRGGSSSLRRLAESIAIAAEDASTGGYDLY